jgi:hypothetical protein
MNALNGPTETVEEKRESAASVRYRAEASIAETAIWGVLPLTKKFADRFVDEAQFRTGRARWSREWSGYQSSGGLDAGDQHQISVHDRS